MAISTPFLVLDTETTGLQRGSEIINIAIVGHDGTVYLDTLLKPTKYIPADTFRIHGINNDMVADAPSWTEIKPFVCELLQWEQLIVYNSKYDRKIMHFTDENHCLPHTEYKTLCNWWDCMGAFSEWYGEKHAYYGTFTWQKLSTAVEIVNCVPANAHRALGDCLMTLELVKQLAKINQPSFGEWKARTSDLPF